jgi:hypothetical protein
MRAMMFEAKRRGVTLRQIVLAIVVTLAGIAILRSLLVKSPEQRLTARFESKFADLHARLQKCLDECPAASDVKNRPLAGQLSPPLDANNTILVSIDSVAKARSATDDQALKDLLPDKRLKGDDSDLVYRWRKGATGQSAFMEIGISMLPGLYDDLLDARYLVAVRFLDWNPPRRDESVTNYIQLIGGTAKVTVYVCDLQSGELLGSSTREIAQDRGLVSSAGDPVETATDEFAELVGNSVRATVGELVGSKLDENPLRDVESRMESIP